MQYGGKKADGYLPPPFGKCITHFSSFLLDLGITFLFEVVKIFFLKYQTDGKNKGGANYLLLV